MLGVAAWSVLGAERPWLVSFLSFSSSASSAADPRAKERSSPRARRPPYRPSATIITVDLFSGAETRSLGRDLDPSGGAHLTEDAVYIFQPSTRELVRLAKATGEATVVANLPETRWIHAFASDACYVYAAVDGFRSILRIPRR